MTADDFTNFSIAKNLNLIMTLEINCEQVPESPATSLLENYITIATRGEVEPDPETESEEPEIAIDCVIYGRTKYSGSSRRYYEINLSKVLPQAIDNGNLAVIFSSTYPAVKGCITLTFKNQYEKIDTNYWNDEIEASKTAINNNIMSAGAVASTILFISDLHWNKNKKKSPELVKQILDGCNIGAFVNGGDYITKYHALKADAVKELCDAFEAFQNESIRIPMITAYGNHDRNRDGNPHRSDPDASDYVLTKQEHVNIAYDVVANRFYGIHHLDDTVNNLHDDAFYWEDANYRYLVPYWYSSTGRNVSWTTEAFDTDKKVVVINHGIYFKTYNTMADDVYYTWLLNLLEPYKDQIRCFIQGHTHRDALRFAYGETHVPIIIIDCDTFINAISKSGTISEQSFAAITISPTEIKVVKIGRGTDWPVINSDTNPFRYIYSTGEFITST
jgi:UDP-2,3-diacylglucosamine pyrophosphatase LpxH